MSEVKDIAKAVVGEYMANLEADVKENLAPRRATGKSERLVSSKVEEDGDFIVGVVTLPPWIYEIEDGVEPYRNIGGSNFYKAIHEWAVAKGITDSKDKSISGAIAHSIIENGTKLYQEGGFYEVVPSNLQERADMLAYELGVKYLDDVFVSII